MGSVLPLHHSGWCQYRLSSGLWGEGGCNGAGNDMDGDGVVVMTLLLVLMVVVCWYRYGGIDDGDTGVR